MPFNIGEQVHIRVKDEMKDCYFPNFLHDFIGDITDIDDEHIWIKGVNKDINGKSYVSGPHRYPICDISIEKL